MSQYDTAPPPQSLVDRLRAIPPGHSLWIHRDEAPASSIRATISRIRRGDDDDFTTRLEGDGVRVWRLS